MTVERELLSAAGRRSTYTFTVPSGGTLWGNLQYVNTLTSSFTVSPSTSGGSATTSTLAGLSGGNWSLSRLPSSTWLNANSFYYWWNGNAGSWTYGGTFSIGFFMVCTSSTASSGSAIIANWVNNIEAWGMLSNGSNNVYYEYNGASKTFTLNQVYWVNLVCNGSNITMYVDDVSSSVGTTAYKTGGSGYLSLFNYYSVGSYRPAGVYINNLKIYTGTSSKFGPV